LTNVTNSDHAVHTASRMTPARSTRTSGILMFIGLISVRRAVQECPGVTRAGADYRCDGAIASASSRCRKRRSDGGIIRIGGHQID
jgi:hypothetical protein